jgi:hypothetical protein
VHVPATGSANDFDDIVGSNPAAGHDLNPPSGKLDHLTERRGAFNRRRRAAACQNAGAVDLDQSLQLPPPIGDKIEGAMKYRGTGTGHFDKLAAARLINRSTSIENPKHNPRGAEVKEALSVAKHRRKLMSVITNPPGARPHHNHERQPRKLENGLSQTK